MQKSVQVLFTRNVSFCKIKVTRVHLKLNEALGIGGTRD